MGDDLDIMTNPAATWIVCLLRTTANGHIFSGFDRRALSMKWEYLETRTAIPDNGAYGGGSHGPFMTRRISSMHINCPHCHSSVEVKADTDLAGLQCSSCHATFSLSPEDTLDYVPPGAGKENASLDVPSRIGQFTLTRRVSRGSLGEVWQAHDTTLNRAVILKFRPMGPSNDFTAQLCEREVAAASRLDHPNIGKVYDVVVTDNRLFIVSEYIDGTQLDTWADGQPISPTDAASICRQIAHAIAYAHSRGVVHRDLKPSNIIIDDMDVPHIIDFGLAHLDDDDSHDAPGLLLGTPAYMSPEQASGSSQPAAPTMDIYAIGVILYELLTGQRPFLADTPKLLEQILHEEPPTPGSLNPDVPRDIEAVCLKCLAKEPSSRYRTAQDLGKALERCLSDTSATGAHKSRLSVYRRVQDQLTPLSVVLLAILVAVLLPATLSRERLVLAAVIATVLIALIVVLAHVAQRHPSQLHARAADSSTSLATPEAQRHRQLCDSLRQQVQERTQMLLNMKSEYEIYQTLVEGLPLGVFRKDLDGRFVYANDYFSKSVAHTPNAIIGKTAFDIFDAELAAQQEANDGHVLAERGGSFEHRRARYRRASRHTL